MPFSHKNFACKITIFTSKISRKRQKWKNEWPEKFGTRSRFPAICWRCSRIKKFEKIHRFWKRKTISNTYKGIRLQIKRRKFLCKKLSICLKIRNSSPYVLTLIMGVNFKLEESLLGCLFSFELIFATFFFTSKTFQNHRKSEKWPEIGWNYTWMTLRMVELQQNVCSIQCDLKQKPFVLQ